jgi:predicted Zn-dependent protease
MFLKYFGLFKKIAAIKIVQVLLILGFVLLFVNDSVCAQDAAQDAPESSVQDAAESSAQDSGETFEYLDESDIDFFGGGANALYAQAQKSVESEYWERAISLLNEGKRLYPYDYRFPESLGSIYFSREFYNLAKEEWLIVDSIMPNDIYVLDKLAKVSSSLNENKEAASYYERILDIYEEDSGAISELAWIYFKIHKLEEGEKLLLDAIKRFGPSARFAMTLGIIYSEMLNYEESKKWYWESVNQSTYYPYLASLAYYNFSILESRFYNYKECFDLAEDSLKADDRDSGHMAKGELFLRRLSFSQTFNEYEKAYEMDKRSPLPKLSLAETFLMSGRLEEARLYAEDCAKITNHAWMVNFGIDPAQYKKEINDILYRTYQGLLNEEKLHAYGTLKGVASSLIKQIKYNFKYHVHELLYYKHSLETARSYDINTMGSQHLYALANYYNAFGNYKTRSVSYLNAAERYELAIIDKAESSYLFERGRLYGDKEALLAALILFDKTWQRDMIADTYTELYKIDGAKFLGSKSGKERDAENLYMLNPGALRQAGISLPVIFNINAKDKKPAKKIENYLSKSGFQAVNAKDDAQCRFMLWIEAEDKSGTDAAAGANMLCRLYDRTSGSDIMRTYIRLDDYSPESIASFANNVASRVFAVK